MRRNSGAALAVAGMLVIAAGMTPGPSVAQAQVGAPTSGGLFGSSPIVLIGNTSKAMTEYYTQHKHLPQTSAEQDEALKAVFTKLTGSAPSAQPTQENKYRLLGNIMLGQDTSLKNANLDELRKNPPASLTAPPLRLVILVTSPDQFMCWYSANDGKPAVDALRQAIILRQSLGE